MTSRLRLYLQISNYLVLWPWASHLTSMGFSFHSWEMDMDLMNLLQGACQLQPPLDPCTHLTSLLGPSPASEVPSYLSRHSVTLGMEPIEDSCPSHLHNFFCSPSYTSYLISVGWGSQKASECGWLQIALALTISISFVAVFVMIASCNPLFMRLCTWLMPTSLMGGKPHVGR